MESKRPGRKPDSVVAAERGITLEELRSERKERLRAKSEKHEELPDHKKDFYDYFDAELNDIAAAMDACKERMNQLSKCRSHERKLNFVCKQFVDEIHKCGFDHEIALGRARKLFEEK